MQRMWAHMLAAAGGLLALGMSGAAHGQSAQANGFSQANVVLPGSIVQLTTLRFGQIVRPTAAGTLTIDINGAATGTGGVAPTNYNIAQTGTGRGAASFLLTGTPNRQTTTTLPVLIVISNGVQTMRVNAFTANTNGGGKLKLDATTGQATLLVGATLALAANQAPGDYSGTYVITVAFQ